MLSQSPPADLDHIYHTLIQEERSRDIARGKSVTDDVHAFGVQTDRGRTRFDRVDRPKLMCTHCHKKGHEAASCFQLHGKPEWWEAKFGRGAKNGAASVRDSLGKGSSGELTTVPASATSFRGGPVTAYAVLPDGGGGSAEARSPLVDLSPSQVKACCI